MPRNRNDGVNSTNKEVGRRLKQRRLSLGLDQKDVAQLVQVTEKTISNWEIGLHSPAQHLSLLAAALGVSEGWIWDGEGKAIDQDQICKLLEELIRTEKSVLDQIMLVRVDLARKANDGDGSTIPY